MTDKKKYEEDEGISLLELLAIDRTMLANERTFFAYIRAAISMALAGLTFITFISNKIFVIVGYIFVPMSFLVVIVAAKRYIKLNKDLKRIGKHEK